MIEGIKFPSISLFKRDVSLFLEEESSASLPTIFFFS